MSKKGKLPQGGTKKVMFRNRQVQMMCIDAGTIKTLFEAVFSRPGGCIQMPRMTNVPKDATITNVWWDTSNAFFVFRMLHQSFEPVQLGDTFPHIAMDYEVVQLKRERHGETTKEKLALDITEAAGLLTMNGYKVFKLGDDCLKYELEKARQLLSNNGFHIS